MSSACGGPLNGVYGFNPSRTYTDREQRAAIKAGILWIKSQIIPAKDRVQYPAPVDPENITDAERMAIRAYHKYCATHYGLISTEPMPELDGFYLVSCHNEWSNNLRTEGSTVRGVYDCFCHKPVQEALKAKTMGVLYINPMDVNEYPMLDTVDIMLDIWVNRAFDKFKKYYPDKKF